MKNLGTFKTALTCAVIGMGFACGQQPRPPGPLGIPGAPPVGPANEPEPRVVARGETDPLPAIPVNPNQIAVAEGQSMDQPIMPALEAAKLYEQYSGKRVMLTAAVANEVEVAFVLTGPLTYREAAKMLKMALLMEGVALVEVPGEPNLVQFMRSAPVTLNETPHNFITDEADLPLDDQMVSFLMNLKYVKPEKAQELLSSAVPQGAQDRITVAPNVSGLIIYDNAASIRQMLKVRDVIDVSAAIKTEWVEVVYGDVDEIAERVGELFGNEGSDNQTSRTTRTARNSPVAPPTPGGGRVSEASTGQAGGSKEEIPLQVIGDARTSRILLVGRPTDVQEAKQMIREFDKPSSTKNRQTFRLRFLRVGEFLPIAQNAIDVSLGNDGGGGGSRGALGGGNSSNNFGSSRTNRSNRNSRSSGFGGNSGGFGGGGGGFGGGGVSSGIDEQQIPTAPESVLVGKTLLVGDNVANTIIVNGPPHHIAIVRELIRELDTEAQQLALTAVIGRYTLGDNMNFGVDLANAVGNLGGGSNFSLGGISNAAGGLSGIVDQANGILSPRDLGSLGNILTAAGSAGAGLAVYGQAGNNFGFFINALEANTNFRTIQRSVLTTRNNQTVELNSGRRIAIPTNTFTGSVNGGQSTNIQYEEVGLSLTIQPLINSDNIVSLQIGIGNSTVGGNRDIGELTVPDIFSDTLNTSVTVRDGSAVVLGGIITESDDDSSSGIPILRRIPGIGSLFGSKSKDNNLSELIVMIQPRILRNFSDHQSFSRVTENSMETGSRARAAFPTGRGVLPPEGTMTQKTAPAKSSSKPKRQWITGGSKKKSKIRGRSGRPGSR